MLCRCLCLAVALLGLTAGGCAHKKCCNPPSTSAYPCCPPGGSVGPMPAVAPVGVQAYSPPLAGGPGCCNGR